MGAAISTPVDAKAEQSTIFALWFSGSRRRPRIVHNPVNPI
jgi:hypothetical protein